MLALAYDSARDECDVVYESGALQDEGADLETAVMMLLGTDAPAETGDRVTQGMPRRGWWALAFGAQLRGSKLWMLDECVRSVENAERAIGYTKEALRTLVDDGLVRAVDAVYVFRDDYPDAIFVIPKITKLSGDTVSLSPFKAN